MYLAKSLADIAEHFDWMAANADMVAQSMKGWNAKIKEAESNTWARAAQILRETEIAA